MSELHLNRGGYQDLKLAVTNHSTDFVNVTMYSLNLDVDSAGTPVLADDDFARGCLTWITYIPPDFKLGPEETRELTARIKAPTDANGSYFANLIARPKEPTDMPVLTQEKRQASIGFVVEAMGLLLVTINSSRNSAIIKPDTVKFDPGSTAYNGPLAPTTKTTKKMWEIEIPVYNQGNIYTQVSGEVAIYSENGALVDHASLIAGKGILFPERRRIFTATGNRIIPDGVYLVRSGLRTKEGRYVGGPVAFTVTNGVPAAGTRSEKVKTLIQASLPAFTLSERMINIDVVPGSQRFKGVTLTNNSKETLTLLPRKVTWDTDDKGSIKFLKANEAGSRSCANWLTISPDTVVIPAGMKKPVNLKIKAPEVVDGEYYSAVVFDNLTLKGESLPVDFQLPSALFVNASDPKTERSVAKLMSFTKKEATRKACLFEVVIENQGNTHCFTSGKLEIISPAGDRLDEPIEFGSGESEYILPGRTKVYPVLWQGELEPGEYTATVNVVYNPKIKSLHNLIKFKVEK